MTIDIEKYLIPITNIDLERIISSWQWLAIDKTIVAITKSGDILLKDKNDFLFLLITSLGTIEYKMDDYHDFFNNKASYDLLEDLLLPSLVDKLENNGLILLEEEVYSYTLLPILGGAYDETNIFALNLYEHFMLTGLIHSQIRDKPDGTIAEIKFE